MVSPRTAFERNQRNRIRILLPERRHRGGTRRVAMTLTLPKGGRRVPVPEELYVEPDPATWFPAALRPRSRRWTSASSTRTTGPPDGGASSGPRGSPGLRRRHARPLLGREPGRGFALRRAARGVHPTGPADGPARLQPHEDPSPRFVVGRTEPLRSKSPTTRHLDPDSLDRLDWWIKCLEDEGIYVWLDLHVGRTITPADGLREGADEVARQKGNPKGFCYYNSGLQGADEGVPASLSWTCQQIYETTIQGRPGGDCGADHQRGRSDESLRQHDAAEQEQPVPQCTVDPGYKAFASSTGCRRVGCFRRGCRARARST